VTPKAVGAEGCRSRGERLEYYKIRKKVNRAEFRRALTACSKEIQRLKRKSFVRFSEEIIDTPVALKLKVLSKEHSNGLGTFIKADGSRTEDQSETLETPV
jgi:hypothetical protein